VSRKRKRDHAKPPAAARPVAQPDKKPGTPARSTPPPAPTDSRRSFLWKTWLGLAAVAAAEVVWLVVDFVRPRRAQADESMIVVAGPVDRFEPGSVTAFPQGRFYLVRLDDGGFLAVSRECTHLGCTVPWIETERQFVCPCHSSAFDIRGNVVSPPAPRALDLYEVRIENRVVKVNTANAERRAAFDAGQVTRT
jgi:cytochrome b6-f complex iron-sulfur subunit